MSQCFNCQKVFSSKSSYKYHITNNVCQKRLIVCDRCGQKFECKRNLDYHNAHKVCERSKKPKIVLKSKEKTGYDDLSKVELIDRLKEKDVEIKVLKENPTTNTTNNQFNIIVPYSGENLDEMMRRIPELLHHILTDKSGRYVQKLIEKVHCNESYPEFHNVFVTGQKTPYAMVSFQMGKDIFIVRKSRLLVN